MTDSEGWIDWSGGECPLPPDTPVEYETLDGLRSVCTAGSLDWSHLDYCSDIVRYRVLAPQAQRDVLLAALEYTIKQVPELATVPGIAAAIASVKGGAA